MTPEGSELIFLYFVLPVTVLFYVALWKLYIKAGRKGWEALVPVYNLIIWQKITKKPLWWVIFFFIPGIGVIVGLGMMIEVFNVFGQRSFLKHLAAITIGPFYMVYMAFSKNVKYIGPIDKTKQRKTPAREWADAIVFAVVAATVIRSFFIEAFTIPTPSMEKTLLVGDFLFVSKMSYGARVPMTPLTFPFAHHTLPGTEDTKSYLEWIKFPYYRLPGYEDIERYDIVVFNYPMEDFRPIDKKENYIKRCVGIPGDTIKLENKRLIVNSEPAPQPEKMLYEYTLAKGDRAFNRSDFEELEIERMRSNTYTMTLEAVEEMKKRYPTATIQPVVSPKGYHKQEIYPQDKRFPWNVDNFGPLWVPKKGATISLTPENVALYRREIRDYEQNYFNSLTGMVEDYNILIGLQTWAAKFQTGRFDREQLFQNTMQVIQSLNKIAAIDDDILPEHIRRHMHYDHKKFGSFDLQYFENLASELQDLIEEYADNKKEEIIAMAGKANSDFAGNGNLRIDAIENYVNSAGKPVYVLNGKVVDEYTFKLDYYFMMGDNRNNSADSRYWGFVPHDHIVGKAVFIWMSWDKNAKSIFSKIRWNRLFTVIHD